MKEVILLYLINFKKMLETTMFGRMKQSNGWEHKGKLLTCHLIVFVIEGSAIFFYNGREHLIKKGECVFIPKETYYTANTSRFCEYFFFHFLSDIILVEREMQKKFVNEQPRYSFHLPPTDYDCVYLTEKIEVPEHFDDIMNMIVKCQEYNINIDSTKKLLLDLQFSRIIISLSKYIRTESQDQVLPAILKKIILYIQKNYTEPLSLCDLANKFAVSKSYIARLFKKHLNISAVVYINNLKLDHAAELLKASNMNVTEIAEYLGFSECFYFSRIFKKRFFESPTSYAKHM